MITDRAADAWIQLSNTSFDVLLSVLLLAGSDLAETEWHVQLMVWLAEHDQALRGGGTVGFDLAEIPWDPEDFPAQRDFLLRTADLAATGHRWEVLGYDAPLVGRFLDRFRALVAGMESVAAPEHAKCPVHDVYVHDDGCLLCHSGQIIDM
jgi:hypothetical protein